MVVLNCRSEEVSGKPGRRIWETLGNESSGLRSGLKSGLMSGLMMALGRDSQKLDSMAGFIATGDQSIDTHCHSNMNLFALFCKAQFSKTAMLGSSDFMHL